MPSFTISNKSNTLLIGVTGHRDLLPNDWKVRLNEKNEATADGYLVPFVKSKLEALQQAHPAKQLLLLTGMAEGADLMVTLIAQQLARPIPFIAILATTQDAYLKSFKSDAERTLCQQLLPKASQTLLCDPVAGEPNYREVGITIARYADELIALWNGVDTGKLGGTWEVVRMARTGREMTGKALDLFRKKRSNNFRLHHLLTPRKDSPYSLPRFFNLTSLQSLLPLGTDYSWVELQDKQKRKSTSWLRTFYVEHRTEIYKPGIPFVLFCLTMLFGTWGLLDYDDYVTAYEHLLKTNAPEAVHQSHLIAKDYHHLDGLAAFYKALHFETVLPPTYDGLASEPAAHKIVWRYVLGKYLGMAFYLYAGFLLAFKLMGERARRIQIQISSKLGRSFALILGLNERSFAALASLGAPINRVVVMEPKLRSPFYHGSQKNGAIVINGDPEDPSQLNSLRFYRAKEVFLLGDNDSTNLHIMQQMDRMLIERGHAETRSNWYIQVQDTHKRRFVNRFTHKLPNVHIYSFNLYENIARRLFVQYPIDRFYRTPEADTTHVFIIGFSELGQQIARNCLRLGHFKAGRKLKLTIFTANPEERREAWNRQYPFLERSDAPFDSDKLARQLCHEIFGHLSIDFLPLPQTDFELLSEGFPVYEAIKPGQIVSLYNCLSDEFKSASYLSSLLERLNVLHKHQIEQELTPTDIQVFFYYNFPSDEEITLVERRFNELAPQVPVICFGNVQSECSAPALRDRALDKMAQLTASYYDEVIDIGNKIAAHKKVTEEDINRREQWGSISRYASAILKRAMATWPARREMFKESNRLFADHAFIKLREAREHMPPELRQATGDITQLTAQFLKTWFAKEDSARQVMSHLEHRRWTAEKLVDGWIPLINDEDEIEKCAEFWHNDSAFKNLALSQKRHLDLVPDRILQNLLGHEYHKDTQLIEGIPVLIEVLRETEN